MNQLDKFKEQVDKIQNFAFRNIALIIIGVILYVISPPEAAEIRTLAMIGRNMLWAICLAGLAQFTFTSTNFVKEDKPALGRIFLGACILVGLTNLGTYIAQTGF